MDGGWVKLHRKLNKAAFKAKPLIVALFVDLLTNANHEETRMIWNRKEFIVQRGQLVTGRKTLSARTGITEQSIRTALDTLKSTNTITITSTSKFSIITILNWEEYQLVSTSTSTKKLTNKQPATNQQLTTNKNDKNEKNEKNKHIHDFLNFFNTQSGKNYEVTQGRTEKLEARLKKYSMEQILRAADTLLKSPYHTGQNENHTWYASPDYLIRNDEMIDRWLNAAPTKKVDRIPDFVKNLPITD